MSFFKFLGFVLAFLLLAQMVVLAKGVLAGDLPPQTWLVIVSNVMLAVIYLMVVE